MGYYKNYIYDEEYTGESLVKFYQQNAKALLPGECSGREELVRGAVQLGAPAGIMEDSPGIMLPLGRGHPK